MYYSNQKILSYNKLFNFVIGNRGGGKSYNAKEWCIKSFLKNGSQFIYVRRYKTELEHIDTYFSDIKEKFPDHELTVRGREFYIDKKLAGWAIPLSTSLKEKSTSYPKVDKIIFDEFIIEKLTYHYLKNEVKIFLDFYETVARMRDVRVMFISNAVSMINPYFNYFHITKFKDTKFIKGEEWIVEFYKDDEYVNAKKNTRFGKLIADTEYGAYAIDNEFTNDNMKFIESMTGRCKHKCNFKFMNNVYGIWYGYDNGYLYVSKKTENPEYTFCFTTADHEPNVIMIKNMKYTKLFKDILYAYQMSRVRFETIKAKEDFYNMMGLM